MKLCLLAPGQRQQAGGKRVLLWPHCGDTDASLWQGTGTMTPKGPRTCHLSTACVLASGWEEKGILQRVQGRVSSLDLGQTPHVPATTCISVLCPLADHRGGADGPEAGGQHPYQPVRHDGRAVAGQPLHPFGAAQPRPRGEPTKPHMHTFRHHRARTRLYTLMTQSHAQSVGPRLAKLGRHCWLHHLSCCLSASCLRKERRVWVAGSWASGHPN